GVGRPRSRVARARLALHSVAARRGVRVRPEEKGGWSAIGAGRAKAAHHGLEGGQPVAEALGDLGQRLPFEEVGPQGFIAALEGLLGLQEELAAVLVVHGAISTRLIIIMPG